MKRAMHFVWTQLGLTCVVGLVLLALYTSLGKQLIPLVETLDEKAEEVLSAQLNTPVVIGEIIGGWHWFSPQVKVNNISLGKQEQLHAQRLEAELDVSASLFYRSIIFKKITLDGVKLTIKQDKKLDWYLGSFLLRSNETDEVQALPITEKPLWLELLTQQGELRLQNWQLDIHPYNSDVENVELIDLRLRNKGLQHWLDGEVQLGGRQGAILNTQFEIEGDFWDLTDHKGSGFVELEARDWSSWVPELSPSLKLEQLIVGGKLWVEIDKGLLHSLDGYLDIPSFGLKKQGKGYTQDVRFENARMTLVGRSEEKNWHLWFNSNAKWLSDLKPSLPKGRLSYLDAEAGWQLALQDIDLAQTAYVIEDLDLLPEKYTDYIANLQPQGIAEEVHINILPKKNWLWNVTADLKETSVIGWKGIPTVENINAHVELTALKGRASVRKNNTILNFPDLYAKYWNLEELTADVYWQIESEYLRLVGNDILANNEQAQIAGDFSLYVPIADSDVEPQLNLSLGFKNLPVSAHSKFLPPAVIPSLSEWLDFNLYEGSVSQGSFLFSGYIGDKKLKEALTVQLYLDLEDIRLSYLTDWPEINNIQAKLMVDSPDVNVWIETAETLGGKLVRNTGRIRIRTDENDVAWMSVKAEIEGSAKEGLKYLQVTPLEKEFDGAFDQWQAKGSLNTNFYARIPLQEELADSEPLKTKIRLKSMLNKATLDIKDVDLTVEDIIGELEFDSDKGLSANKLTAKVMGGETVASISSEVIDGSFDISISAEGQAQSNNVKAWQPLFLLKPVNGSFNYQADMSVKPPLRGGLSLALNSDLKGISIDTPIPFGKLKEEQVPFVFTVNKSRDLRIGFEYGELANGVFSIEANELKRGQVYLGTTKAYLPSDSGLIIKGNLPVEIDAKAWWDLWQEILPKTDESLQASSEAEASDELLMQIDISAPKVNALDIPMGSSHIVGEYKWRQWNFDLTSDLITGKIKLPNNKPMVLDLDYIHLPVSDDVTNKEIKFGSSEAKDPLQDVDPKLIPDMHLKVEEVFLGTSNYGRWDLTIKQQENYTQIHVNDSLSKALSVKGDINWSKSEEGHKTHLELLRIESKNLGDSQRAFRNAAAIESEDARFDVDMTWLASPAKFNYATLNGYAKVSIKDGLMISDNAGALKAFGVLNFNSIVRRLKLDFSDLYEAGVVFDTLKARMSFKNGIATYDEPLSVDSPSGKFQSSGMIDFNTEEINQKLIVTFPIGSSLPLVAVIAGLAPQIAGAIYVTEKLIGEELEKFTSASYTVTGTIENPEMNIDKAFDNELEGKESRSFKNRFLDIFGLGDDE